MDQENICQISPVFVFNSKLKGRKRGMNFIVNNLFCKRCNYVNNAFSQYVEHNTKRGDITALRKKIKVLIVDDKKLEAINTLITSNVYSIYYKNDIKYTVEAEPYDIVICDIRGVATEFHPDFQGLGFAEEVKKTYPTKLVFCYSAEDSAPSFLSKIKNIDDTISKFTNSDEWIKYLDAWIEEFCSIEHQWNSWERHIRTQFNLSEDDINVIKNNFIKAIKNGEIREFQDNLLKIIKDLKFVIDMCITIYKLYTIFNS